MVKKLPLTGFCVRRAEVQNSSFVLQLNFSNNIGFCALVAATSQICHHVINNLKKMGLESYLITVAFTKPVDQTEIVNIFQESGATFLTNKSNTEPVDTFRHWYFEVRTEHGLTEIDIMLTPNKTSVTNWTIRFSILSPAKVIDQTFNFLSKLRTKRSLKAFDSDNKSKELDLDIIAFKANKDKVKKLQIIINNKNGLVIEGGSVTTQHISDNNLMEKIWRES